MVWFNAFTPGGHIRRQMEEGLKTSTFGVVIVSPQLFQKKWALEEVDALYSMEKLDSTRIIPVWHGVSAAEVQQESPMLLARFAIVRDEVAAVAADIGDVIIDRTFNRSPAQWLRSVVGGGISWYTGPSWLGLSLRQYDDYFAEFFPAEMARFPAGMPRPGELFPPLIEVLRAPVMHDGTICTVIGHQDPPQSSGIASTLFVPARGWSITRSERSGCNGELSGGALPFGLWPLPEGPERRACGKSRALTEQQRRPRWRRPRPRSVPGARAPRPCGSRRCRRRHVSRRTARHVRLGQGQRDIPSAELGGSAEDLPAAHLSGGSRLLHHSRGRQHAPQCRIPHTRHGSAKNRLENHLPDLVFSGQLPPSAAQQATATDWWAAYQQYGKHKPPRPRPAEGGIPPPR